MVNEAGTLATMGWEGMTTVAPFVIAETVVKAALDTPNRLFRLELS